jgi:hypothetical protein
MTKRKNTPNKHVSIKVGNLSDISSAVNIAGGDISTQVTTSLNAAEIEKLFKHLYTAIEERPDTSPADKADLKAEVKEIHKAIKKAEKDQKPLKESFLARRFHNIANIAPDILDVVVATLPPPASGVAMALKKIVEKAKAEKAKAEASQKEPHAY